MSTLATPGPFDALSKAEDDEPIFPLLGRDPCAPATITEWCRLRRNRAYKLYGDKLDETSRNTLHAELFQASEAEVMALRMSAWRTRTEPAAEDPSKPTYNEIVKSTEEIEQARRLKILKDGIAHLRESAYHFNMALEVFETLGYLFPETAKILPLINNFAAQMEPHR